MYQPPISLIQEILLNNLRLRNKKFLHINTRILIKLYFKSKPNLFFCLVNIAIPTLGWKRCMGGRIKFITLTNPR